MKIFPLAAGVNDTVHLELRISPWMFEKIKKGPNGMLKGKLIHEKNLKSKISWHCPFNYSMNSRLWSPWRSENWDWKFSNSCPFEVSKTVDCKLMDDSREKLKKEGFPELRSGVFTVGAFASIYWSNHGHVLCSIKKRFTEGIMYRLLKKWNIVLLFIYFFPVPCTLQVDP